MSLDVRCFCICDHIVDGQQYILNTCPRCYGKGYYLDIFFDTTGEAVLISGSLKLQQEILKIVIDEKYRNEFHPNWGSELKSNFIGSKNFIMNRIKLELVIRRALEYLKSVQLNENANWNNMTNEEILDTIEYIQVTPIDKTGYYVEVSITNSVGQLYAQTIIL